MKRSIALVCLLFSAALVFGGSPEPAGHLVLFQHLLQARLQNWFGAEDGEALPLSADGPGEPQHQSRAQNQTCDPDCEPCEPCEPDRLRTRDRGESCEPDPICTADAEGDQDQQQDQQQDKKKTQQQLQGCK
jgi:hypothetical protein